MAGGDAGGGHRQIAGALGGPPRPRFLWQITIERERGEEKKRREEKLLERPSDGAIAACGVADVKQGQERGERKRKEGRSCRRGRQTVQSRLVVLRT